MKCDNCGGQLEVIKGNYLQKTFFHGPIQIPNITHEKCLQCGSINLLPGEAKKIQECLNKLQEEALGALPVSEFVMASEAAVILGVSRQGFNKNNKIKRGFIYSVYISGKQVFYRPSVLAFLKKGDGRIDLFKQASNYTGSTSSTLRIDSPHLSDYSTHIFSESTF